MTHPLYEEFTSYRRFVTTTWSKPPAILQELIQQLTDNIEISLSGSTFYEAERLHSESQIKQLRACQLSFNIQHAMIGLQGEALEVYLEDDLEEELGDILYYLTQASNFLDVGTDHILKIVSHKLNPNVTVVVSDPQELIKPLLLNIETLCNLLKKVYIYNQSFEIHALGISHHILNCYSLIGMASPFQEIMRENRAKLEKRYSKGFSTQASIERADKCVD